MAELTDLDGVADGRASNLKDAGYESVEDLTDADPETVADEVNYLPQDTALELIVQSQNIVEEEMAEVEEDEPGTITEEVSKAVEKDDDPDESDESNASEESDEPDVIDFSLSFDEPLEYDTFFDALLQERASHYRTNRSGVETFEAGLEQMRNSRFDEDIELSLTPSQLNSLHQSVSQLSTSYKGDNLIDHMEALDSVLADINSVRSENLF